MTLQIPLPANVERALRSHLGDSLERQTKEDLAAQWFSEGRITSGLVAEMLGISWVEAQAFLKARGATAPMTIDEVIADADSLRELREH